MLCRAAVKARWILKADWIMTDISVEQTIEFITQAGMLLSDNALLADSLDVDLWLRAGQGNMLYFVTSGKVDDPAGAIKLQYLTMAARQLKQRIALQELFELLEENKIAFVPIKGADLAFRIYPAPALRSFGDWDIWVQKSDLKRFCALLEAQGWRCKLNCYSDHHCGMRSKGDLHLEPHFSLPNFPDVSPAELWSFTEAVPGKTYQRQLTDSLNFMMLFQHNSINYFQSSHLIKLLWDAEYLLQRGQIDWQWLEHFSCKWQLPNPALLLEAFPEFFRSRYNCSTQFETETVAALRELLLQPASFSAEASRVNASEMRWGSWHWLKIQLLRMRKENLRWMYPEIGDSSWRYIKCLGCEILRKLQLVSGGRRKMSPELQAHLQRAALVNDSWKNLRRKPEQTP